jgi:hypothetical protein
VRRYLAAPLASLIVAAAPLAAQQPPPVRPLGPVTKVSPPDVLGSVSVVRPLTGGGVIVSDVVRRQIVLLDADFRKVKGVFDSTTEAGNHTSGPMAGLLPFKGDSSLVVDPRTLSMLVIDANGEVARVMAVPSVRDVSSMVGGPFGTPGLDPRGGILFRGPPKNLVWPESEQESSKSPPLRATAEDTAPVLRVDIATRSRDTLAFVRIPQSFSSIVFDNSDRPSHWRIVVNPLPTVDDWALMPDGRVAVVRGKDYHVDWLELDGQWTSTGKIPYPWERLSDDAKQRVVDSVTAESEKEREAARQKRLADSVTASRSSTVASPRNSGVPAARQQSGSFRITREMVLAKELPDYRPAFKQGAARADADGNLWVRTTIPSDKGPIYDVINAKGELIDRVKLPFGRVISGFGPGVVYMGVLDDKGARLEMARIK